MTDTSCIHLPFMASKTIFYNECIQEVNNPQTRTENYIHMCIIYVSLLSYHIFLYSSLLAFDFVSSRRKTHSHYTLYCGLFTKHLFFLHSFVFFLVLFAKKVLFLLAHKNNQHRYKHNAKRQNPRDIDGVNDDILS